MGIAAGQQGSVRGWNRLARSGVSRMQRRFSATGLITFFFVVGAGVLLTVQLHHLPGAEEWAVPVWLLWLGEICAYLTALLIWTGDASLLSLFLGIAAMFLLRLAIGTGAASVSYLLHPAGNFTTVLGICLSGLLPRICSLVFAIMAFYPLRGLVPRRPTVIRLKDRAVKGSSLHSPTLSSSGSRSGVFLFGAPGLPAAGNNARVSPTPSAPVPGASASPLPAHLQDWEIHLPLQLIACQLPPGVLRPEVMERLALEKLEVPIPLGVVAPQLKEALIQVSVAALLTFLPKGWADTPAAGGEERITLPLEVVVPQLPEEVLRLPAPFPPTWAAALQEEEKVLFARV